MHTDSLMSNKRTNHMIDECLNNVHAGLKAKNDCKNILAVVSKVFVQELIEESLEVV